MSQVPIWVLGRTFGCPAGHLDLGKCPFQVPGTKFDLEKNFCSFVPGHVLSRIAKSRGCLIEIVRARPVLGTWIWDYPICFPAAT